jgi:hypothetical protein
MEEVFISTTALLAAVRMAMPANGGYTTIVTIADRIPLLADLPTKTRIAVTKRVVSRANQAGRPIPAYVEISSSGRVMTRRPSGVKACPDEFIVEGKRGDT